MNALLDIRSQQGRSMNRVGVVLLGCALVLADASFGKGKEEPFLFSGKISALRETETILGKDWELRPGMVLDDFQNPPNYDAETNQLRDVLIAQCRPMGVVACGDIAYLKKGTLNLVTLRVFVFKSAEAAQAWWIKKYEQDDWEKHYKKVEGIGERAVDSVQTNKRILLVGNVWLTCHQLHQGDECRKLLDHFLRKITTGGAPNAKE